MRGLKKIKQRAILKLQMDMRVIGLVAYHYRKIRPDMRRQFAADLDKTFGNGPGDLQGLAPILEES